MKTRRTDDDEEVHGAAKEEEEERRTLGKGNITRFSSFTGAELQKSLGHSHYLAQPSYTLLTTQGSKGSNERALSFVG